MREKTLDGSARWLAQSKTISILKEVEGRIVAAHDLQHQLARNLKKKSFD